MLPFVCFEYIFSTFIFFVLNKEQRDGSSRVPIHDIVFTIRIYILEWIVNLFVCFRPTGIYTFFHYKRRFLHRMPRDPRMAIGSFLGLPTNTRTNPERNANRRVGTSNYNFKMEQLRGERTSHNRRKTRKCARNTSRRSRQNK